MPTEIPLPDGISSDQAVAFAREGFPGTLMERLEIDFLEIASTHLKARMPVKGNTQVYGMLHGGATAALCETIASYGTALIAGLDKMVTGVELNVNHIRAVRDGYVTVTAVPLHVGRTTAVW
ncbi:MAG: PaaI family thioesterase, partial [Actinobacteria bacterium]|nr:PaaI family thioesterase [Actinomycetota bacterium]